MRSCALLPDHLDENPVGQLAFDQVNHAVLDEALEDLAWWARFRLLYAWRGRCAGGWDREQAGTARTAAPAGCALSRLLLPHAAVHGIVGQLIGLLVAATESVRHLEALEPAGEAFGLFPEGKKAGVLDLIDTLHLLDHQLGVRNDLQ